MTAQRLTEVWDWALRTKGPISLEKCAANTGLSYSAAGAALRALNNLYPNVLEKVRRGVYVAHPDRAGSNGRPEPASSRARPQTIKAAPAEAINDQPADWPPGSGLTRGPMPGPDPEYRVVPAGPPSRRVTIQLGRPWYGRDGRLWYDAEDTATGQPMVVRWDNDERDRPPLRAL